MSVSAPAPCASSVYWEQRARRFADQGAGLAAVCSYGMPEFYNRAIQLSQRLALRRWLHVAPGTRVLDVGCGLGRWSRPLAARGALVSGIDLSPTMIGIARKRALAEGVADRCSFITKDLAHLQLQQQFDLVLGVTVLQHILDLSELRGAVTNLAAHLKPGGRMVLLEAAPVRANRRCDTPIFTARRRQTYLDLFAESGLELRALRGVDPAPFKSWLLPHLQRLPAALRLLAIAAATGLSLPIDALFGRRLTRYSWHAVFVLEHARETHHGI
jgi:2-polyprenyl-3-methyl-5-hydroxy-6-metoxy-1,4-benzoquinol methylase